MPSAFDLYTAEFARFIETGRIGNLAAYCESGANTELFSIYRNGYLRSALDTLVSNYPAVHALLGDAAFRQLSRDYIVQFPPASGSLVGYGSEFAMFLEETRLGRELPYLADLARLDRGWLDVYFAADSEVLTPAGIAALVHESGAAGSPPIALIPAATIVALSCPLTEAWRQLKDRGSLDHVVELTREPEQTLLWRAGTEVLIRKLSAVEFIFLSSLLEGLNFEEATENAVDENAKFDFGSFFSNLIFSGLLARAATAPNHSDNYI